jgi:ATP-dependent Lon protease
LIKFVLTVSRVEMTAERQASEEVFSQRREDDILTKALGTEEHRGRTRGIGSNVPWKHGFPQYTWQYRKHKLSKAQKDARLKEQLRDEIRDELREEFDEKLLQVKARVEARLRESEPAAAPIVETSPTQRRSSCASTEVVAQEPPAPTAVDHITVKSTKKYIFS